MQIRLFLALVAATFFCFNAKAVNEPDKKAVSYEDSVENSLKYQRGEVSIKNGLAKLLVPQGYKFLDAMQSKHVLENLWGNPADESTLGLLLPENISPVSENFSYAVEITYSEEGYIKDDDAKDIDYNELLDQMKADAKAENEYRVKEGYSPVELVGWASKPFYDENSKKLHWAKEIRFGEDSINTLNYNIRILGRKGFLNLNAIGKMNVLPAFQQDVNKILASVEFNQGHTYAEFNPDIDQVAAYGIGGLIAGKVLAKAGFFAILLKSWKIILVALAGLFAVLKKKLFGSKETVAATDSAE